MKFNEILNEEAKTILCESIYDQSKLDEIVDYIYPLVKGKDKSKINISKKVREVFPFISKSITIYVIISKTYKEESGGTEPFHQRTVEGDTRVPFIEIKVYENTLSSRFKKVLLHELIHALDYCKVWKTKRKFSQVVYKKNTEKVYLTYRKGKLELNQTVQFVSKLKKTKEYNEIKTIDKLMEYVFVKTSPEGRKTNALMSNGYIDKHFIKDESLRRDLVNRLARENLLPDAMTNK